MRVLVTGASGLVGSHVVTAAIQAGHEVRCLVRERRPAHLHGSELIQGDVRAPESLGPAVEGVDAVIHAAGLVRARSEREFLAVNADGCGALARAAAAAGAGRLVVVSSLAARGPEGSGGPVSAYGRSKRAGEEQARAALPPGVLVLVRPTAVYGPRDVALAPLFRCARAGLRPALASDAVLTVIHAADLARGLVGLAAAKTVPLGAPLEASDGEAYTWRALAEAVAAAVERPGRARTVPVAALTVAARIADLAAAVARRPLLFGGDKLKDVLGSWPCDAGPFWAAAGLSPRFDLALGLRDTAMSYRRDGRAPG